MAMRTLARDPMIRMLVVAMALAAIVPVTGASRGSAQMVVNVAIFVLFLLNGIRTARGDVAAGMRNWRFLLPLVLWVFGAMALIGLGASLLTQPFLPALLAAGLLYLGCLPSTVQSATSYSSLAGGNVALSVIAAALLNLLGVFVSAPIFLALGGSGEGAIGSDAVMKIVVMLIVPFALGQIVQGRMRGHVLRHRQGIVWLDRGIIAAAVYVAVSGAVEQGIGSRVAPAGWGVLALAIAAFLALAHAGSWLASGWAGLTWADRIAFLFAGSQKSAAIGVPLATILFPAEVAGFIVVPLLLYHFAQLVVAAPLASRLSAAPLPDDGDCSAPTTRS
ncbi:MAG: bile acid:sodium symporter [Citromicrobium sp.]|nr:MAG: bile acid:sodium symporter [Citromicrobium sp.]